jgi:hypothetical protein
MNTYPQRIDAWLTSDGEIFSNQLSAIHREEDLGKVATVNRMLDAGESIATALEATGETAWLERDRDILSQITKHVGLTISHWQCRDEPGYSLIHRTIDGWRVAGDSGSWSGYYGGTVGLLDLIRYARATAAKHGGMLPPVWMRPPTKEPSHD